MFLNSELGMRNVELKKDKGLILYIRSLSPICCALVTPQRDDGWRPLPLAPDLKSYSLYLSLFSAFPPGRMPYGLEAAFQLPNS